MMVLKQFRAISEVASGLTYGCFRSKTSVKHFCQSLDKNDNNIFFKEEVQSLLKGLTKVDYEKVFRPRKLGKKLTVPTLKFMTDEELQEAQEKSKLKALKKLQMPPVIPPRTEIDHVFVKDVRLEGYNTSKYVFTDITFGKDDRTRQIVVRDVDGTLRKANWQERERCNEIYFPRPGRKFRIPAMFKPGFFEDVLEKGWYDFILERACIQFEPDDPLFISITQRTYDKIAETKRFQEFESTRFFGPLVFHLTEKENLSPLLIYYLNYDRLTDILILLKLHNILHPEKQGCSSFSAGEELNTIKAFIRKNYPQDSELELALKSYEDYLRRPKSQAAM